MHQNILNDKTYSFLHGISGSDRWRSAELVGGGWSSDVKFKVTTDDGEHLLLRISDIKSLDKKRAEYDAVCEIAATGVNMSKPYEFAIIEGADKLYMKLSWLEGDNVEEAMPKYTPAQQYQLGLKAGRLLRAIHTLPSKLTPEQWKAKNIKVLTERVEIYRGLKDYKIAHFDEMMKFIDDSFFLLDNRSLVFHHGDYQGRNIIVSDNGEVGVIDFERTSSGDPYEEFNRMMTYTRRFSVDFSRGQIDGYFENEKIPDEFFHVMAFHTAMKLLTTIIFGVSTNQKHIYEENELAKEVIYKDYDGFRCVVPSWYKMKKS